MVEKEDEGDCVLRNNESVRGPWIVTARWRKASCHEFMACQFVDKLIGSLVPSGAANLSQAVIR